ncbi:flavodoxin family protein [Pengzhenrongella phosphoraccumulans]|uniref:flavodoxin family protein n=1 Tax=Pengzhenrongella phosphoraccumulans TaxID=3114394 RepID=UPI00388DF22A
MTSLVVYESMFGATKALAEEIAQTLGEAGPVRVVEVGALAAEGPMLPADVDLLVVGAPVHAFGMSRASTRLDATKEMSPVISATIGVREWLDDLIVRSGLRCATFDTKVLTPRLPGSAAKAIDKHLRSAGAVRACPPHTFSVNGKSGGLVDGELTSARAWAGTLIPRS